MELSKQASDDKPLSSSEGSISGCVLSVAGAMRNDDDIASKLWRKLEEPGLVPETEASEHNEAFASEGVDNISLMTERSEG